MKKILLILVVFISFTITSCMSMQPTYPSNDKKMAQIYYEMAKNTIINKDYSRFPECFSDLKKAQTLDPNNPNIYFVYALLFRLKKDDNLAKQYLDKTIKLDKNYYDAYNELGVIYFDEGDLAKSKALFDKLINTLTYSNIDVAYYNRALVYLAQKDTNKAINDLQSAIIYSDYKNPMYWHKITEIYFKNHDYEKCLAVIQDMENHLGPSDYVHYTKALCYYKIGLKSQAKDEISKISNNDNYYSIQKDLLLKKIEH